MDKLIWSPKSLHDLEQIFMYIANDTEEYARIFIKKIIDIVITIPDFPELGRIVPEIKRQDLREKIYKNYRIIYRYSDNTIEIVTIVHHAKQLDEDELQYMV